MFKYRFYWKRWLFWTSREVVGHKLSDNTMVLYFENGGLETIPHWHHYKLKLGADWALSVKKNTEAQTGVDLKTTFSQ